MNKRDGEKAVPYVPKVGSPLTAREVQSLWCKAHGLTYDGAAKKMGANPKTVKTHLRRAYARLGANDCAHAVALCFRMGVFPPPGRFVLTLDEMARDPRRRGA